MPPTTMTPKNIADQLRALIAAEVQKGVSLREIARRSNAAPMVISRLMNGRTVTMETAESIAKALGKVLKLA